MIDKSTIGNPDLIPQDKIEQVLKRVVPLLERDGQLQRIDISNVNAYSQSYIWAPKLVGPMPFEVEPFDTIETYHTFGHYGLFKPSLAEVVQRLPDDPQIVAFSLCGPGDAAELTQQKGAVEAGYHTAKCTLYRKAS